jgi:hypothetical protein
MRALRRPHARDLPRHRAQAALQVLRRYHVCNNRLNHQSCTQEYVRADILETSVIGEIAKLADRKDFISALVADYVARNRKAVPELEEKRQAILRDLATVGSEKLKLSQWLLGAGLTTQAVAFINAQIDALCEKETRLQEEQWGMEDRLTELRKATYNAEAIAGALKDFVRVFAELDLGERRLMIGALVEWVEVGKQKRVTALLRPPLSFGSLTASSAPRGIEPLFEE